MSVMPASNCARTFAHIPLNALNAFSLFDLFDDALADMFCLHTYTHGTSPKGYYSILSQGADPSQGGRPDKGEGAMYAFRGTTEKRSAYSRENTENWDSTGKFYVFKDRFVPDAPCCIAQFFGGFAKKMGARMYATQASVGELALAAGDGCASKTASIVGGVFSSFYSPTIKFRFLPEEVAAFNFELDKTHDGAKDEHGNYINEDECPAAFTRNVIPSDHIGLYGTLSRAFSGNLIGRIQADPWRFMQGLLKLITIAALAAIVIIGALYSPVVALLAMIFVACETSLFVGRIIVPIIASCFIDTPAAGPPQLEQVPDLALLA